MGPAENFQKCKYKQYTRTVVLKMIFFYLLMPQNIKLQKIKKIHIIISAYHGHEHEELEKDSNIHYILGYI